MKISPETLALLKEFLGLIREYGVPVIFLIAILIWAKPWADKIMARVLEVKAALPVIEKEDMVALIRLNSGINTLLKEMRADFLSDWTQLWQFHNGSHGIGKLKIPFMYLSLTHETHTPNVEGMQKDFEQLPMSMFVNFAAQIISKDCVIHPPREVDPQDTVSRMGDLMVNQFGAKISIMKAVRDEDGLVVGFITTCWNNKVEATEERIAILRMYAYRMTVLLATFRNDQDEKERLLIKE